MTRPIVVAVTGASGAVYARRLLEVLLSAGREVALSISPAGAAVLKHELNVVADLERFDVHALRLDAKLGQATGRLHYYHYQDLMAPLASGSFLTAGMVVCPCSGGTMSGIV